MMFWNFLSEVVLLSSTMLLLQMPNRNIAEPQNAIHSYSKIREKKSSYNLFLCFSNVWEKLFYPMTLAVNFMTSFPVFHLTFLTTVMKCFATRASFQFLLLSTLLTTVGAYVLPSIIIHQTRLREINCVSMLSTFS